MAPGRIRTMVVEDNDDMRYLLRVVIELAETDVDVVAEVGRADAAVAAWRDVRPDIVVLDYMMPGTDGLAVATEILAEDPDHPIVLFSAFLDDRILRRADRVGIRECVSKDDIQRLPDVVVEHARK
jgi:two-component system response regulator DesR